MPRAWDREKLNELTVQLDKKEKKLAEITDSLAQQYAVDGTWDDAQNQKYERDQLRHAQFSREISDLRNQVTVMEGFRPANVKKSEKTAFNRWLARGANGLEASERDIYLQDKSDDMLPDGGGEVFLFDISQPDFLQSTRSDNSSGEELVPETVRPNVIDTLKAFGGTEKMAQVFTTGTGNDFRVPSHDDSTEEGELLANQDTAVAQKDLADFKVVSFGAKTMSSKTISITREMIQDSIIDITSFATRRVGRRLGRGWDKQFTSVSNLPSEVNGAPANTAPPQITGMTGVVSVSKLGVTAAAVDEITYDEMVELQYKIEQGYLEGEDAEYGLSPETGGRIGYLISRDAEKVLRLLKDGNDRPIWQPGYGNIIGKNMGPTLMGYPYQVSNTMASVATGNKPVLFGNFSYYGIRKVHAVEIFRFMDSRTMQKNTIEILGLSRGDARPMVRSTRSVQGSGANKTVNGGIEQIAHLKMA